MVLTTFGAEVWEGGGHQGGLKSRKASRSPWLWESQSWSEANQHGTDTRKVRPGAAVALVKREITHRQCSRTKMRLHEEGQEPEQE